MGKVSRRDFARTSVAAGAAAVALPASLLGREAGGEKLPAALAGAAAARRRRITLPPEAAYGGISLDGRDILLQDTLTPVGQTAPRYPGGWVEGTTIPAEYYVDEKHYVTDERFLADHFWLMVDHESRIPKPGDYFVFEFGQWESVIVTRDQAGAVKAYHNVCRHRGSRLVLHGTAFDGVRPSEAKVDGKPVDARMSVVQLGASGSSPVFRCPYHAWTYDLTGKLVSYPPGMPGDFDAAGHGLHACHARTVEGFIFVNFSKQDAPELDGFVSNWRSVCQQYGTAGLKIVARRQYPTKANWKLALENFRECYHCEYAHTRSLVATHWLFTSATTREQRARIEASLAEHGHPVAARQAQPQSQAGQAGRRLTGMAEQFGNHLNVGFATGSLDGKPVAPLLPARKEWTHRRMSATTGFSTAFLAAYDDYVAVARFTPRGVRSTDVEIFWMVHPDAKPKDYDVDRMMAVWDLTYREDRWIVENNHHGIQNSRYSSGQPYSNTEGGPVGFIKWYLTEVVPQGQKSTNAG